MSQMGERKFCVMCGKDVGIVKVITHGNYEEQILSCDHIGGRLNLFGQIHRKKFPCTKGINEHITILGKV